MYIVQDTEQSSLFSVHGHASCLYLESNPFFLSCLSTFVKNYLYMCVNSPLDFYSVSWIDSAVVMPVTLFFLWLNLKSCSQIAFSNFILLELFWFLWVFVGNIESPFHFLQIFLLEFLSWLCCICRSIWSSLVTQW